MKQSIIVFLTVFGLMFAGNNASADKIYTVVNGDSCWKISKKYQGVSPQQIKDANSDIKAPKYWVFPGQKLVIPVPADKSIKKQRREKRRGDMLAKPSKIPEYLYSVPGRNPVGKGTDPAPYIEKFDVPDDVKKQFLAWAKGDGVDFTGIAYVTKANNPDAGESKTFPRLNGMGYGKEGKVVRNVKVMFDILREAWYWQFDFEGTRYYLICDQICYNWSYFSEVIPTFVQPPVVIEVDVPIDAVEVPETVEAPPSFAPKPSRHVMDPDVEAWLYAGTSRGVQNNTGDRGSYYGGNISIFLDKWRMGKGYFRVGPALQWVGWDGTAGNVDYDGSFNLFGAEAQHLTANTKTQLKVLYGEKTGYVHGKGFPYYAKETADLLALEGAYQWWNTQEHYQWEVGFRAEIAMNNDKYSTWDGVPISRSDDPALDQSMYSVRTKRTWTGNKNFMPTLEGSANYRASNDAVAFQIRPGVKLWNETVEPSLHYEQQFVDGKTNGTVGVNVNINLSKLTERVIAWLKS